MMHVAGVTYISMNESSVINETYSFWNNINCHPDCVFFSNIYIFTVCTVVLLISANSTNPDSVHNSMVPGEFFTWLHVPEQHAVKWALSANEQNILRLQNQNESFQEIERNVRKDQMISLVNTEGKKEHTYKLYNDEIYWMTTEDSSGSWLQDAFVVVLI